MKQRAVWMAWALLLILFMADCGSDGSNGGNDNGDDDDTYNPGIDPANFVEGIDNPYLPLIPGTTRTYEANTDEGLETVVVSVTNDTKVIMGVTCIVVRDTASLEGSVIEDTYDWFAQDVDGNVWYFGEDTAEYDNGEIVSTEGSWEAGVGGALPGIVMEGNPQVGDIYRQEYLAGEAEDMAEVLSLDESVTVPYGSFDHCLMTKDWTPLEPGIVEHKYYCENIGEVLAEKVEGGSEREELVSVTNE